jgi:5'-nucleotidase
MVLSGINRGLNLGDDVTYSGTVAGALEGTLLEIPSLAISAASGEDGEGDYSSAARVATQLAGLVLREGLPPGVFLNINVPTGRPGRVRITRQGTRTYRAAAVERMDPSGRPYYWIGGAEMTPAGEKDGDHRAIDEGFVSVTPLHADMTHWPSLETLRAWRITSP